MPFDKLRKISEFPRTFHEQNMKVAIGKGVAYVEATGKKHMQKKYIKTIKLYFHVLNKGTINKLTD